MDTTTLFNVQSIFQDQSYDTKTLQKNFITNQFDYNANKDQLQIDEQSLDIRPQHVNTELGRFQVPADLLDKHQVLIKFNTGTQASQDGQHVDYFAKFSKIFVSDFINSAYNDYNQTSAILDSQILQFKSSDGLIKFRDQGATTYQQIIDKPLFQDQTELQTIFLYNDLTNKYMLQIDSIDAQIYIKNLWQIDNYVFNSFTKVYEFVLNWNFKTQIDNKPLIENYLYNLTTNEYEYANTFNYQNLNQKAVIQNYTLQPDNFTYNFTGPPSGTSDRIVDLTQPDSTTYLQIVDDGVKAILNVFYNNNNQQQIQSQYQNLRFIPDQLTNPNTNMAMISNNILIGFSFNNFQTGSHLAQFFYYAVSPTIVRFVLNNINGISDIISFQSAGSEKARINQTGDFFCNSLNPTVQLTQTQIAGQLDFNPTLDQDIATLDATTIQYFDKSSNAYTLQTSRAMPQYSSGASAIFFATETGRTLNEFFVSIAGQAKLDLQSSQTFMTNSITNIYNANTYIQAVGAGTSAPTIQLEAPLSSSAFGPTIFIQKFRSAEANNALQIRLSNTGTFSQFIQYYSSSPTYTFNFYKNGGSQCAFRTSDNAYVQTSDGTLKKNIVYYDDQYQQQNWEQTKQIKFCKYGYIDNGNYQTCSDFGVISQDLYNLNFFDNNISKTQKNCDDETETVDCFSYIKFHNKIISVLIKQIEKLEAQVNSLSL